MTFHLRRFVGGERLTFEADDAEEFARRFVAARSLAFLGEVPLTLTTIWEGQEVPLACWLYFENTWDAADWARGVWPGIVEMVEWLDG